MAEPLIDADPRLVDPQGWDAYWNEKSRATNIIYDVIATVYRNLVIKRQLNRYIRAHFSVGSQLLHAGCGSGQVDADIQREMCITAVDISLAALSLYRRHNPLAEAVKHANILDLPFPDEAFDGAYNLGVVEHFTEGEIERILSELNRVVKRGGKIVLFWPHARATSVFVLKTAHWLLNDVFKKNVQFHPPEISLVRSRAAVEPLFAKAGFDLVQFDFGIRDFFVQAVIVALRK